MISGVCHMAVEMFALSMWLCVADWNILANHGKRSGLVLLKDIVNYSSSLL